MLTLFYAPGTCALASHIALEESGLAYQAIFVDFRKQEQRTPAYLEINPKGRVPAIATERGVITESPAILAFIAQMAPGAGLAPLDDPFAFGKVQAFNNYLCSTVHVNLAHKTRSERWADDPAAQAELERKAVRTVADSFAMIEREFFEGPWVMGSRYGICDAYLYTMFGFLGAVQLPPSDFPVLRAHSARVAERPAVKRVLAAQAA